VERLTNKLECVCELHSQLVLSAWFYVQEVDRLLLELASTYQLVDGRATSLFTRVIDVSIYLLPYMCFLLTIDSCCDRHFFAFLVLSCYIQCFDAVGWAAGRASGL